MTTATKKPSQNGLAKTTKPSTVKSKQTEKQTPAIELLKQENGFTLEERLQRAEELNALGLRREQLLEKRSHIRQFQFSGEEDVATLIIKDNSGRSFATSNPTVIKGQIESLEKVINAKIAETEANIMKFDV